MRALCLLFALAGAAAAQPTSVINGDPLACFSTVEDGSATLTRSVVDVQGQPFTQALRLKTTGSSPNSWDVRVRCFGTTAVQKDDTLLATFYVRATQGEAMTALVAERGSDPWTKSLEWTTMGRETWRKVQVPFGMLESYAAGAWNLSFWLNFPNQEIEIGGIKVENHGQKVPFSQLGIEGWPYAGVEPNAPWRAEAARRIEKYRKTDIGVVVRDDAGNPIAGAPVRVRMKKHAYGFGTAVAGKLFVEDETYRNKFYENFNKAVLENDLKWPFLDANWTNWRDSLRMLDEKGIPVRGHNLIWPGRNDLPESVRAALTAGNKEEVRRLIREHFTDILNQTRGKLTEWDVLNEPYTSKDVQALLGDAEMAEWFKLARQIDPEPKLYINDYNITEAGGFDLKHQDHYFETIRKILDWGGPIDGIGLQSHFNSNLTPPERVWEILDRFATFGKELQVTEFDINIKDEATQAQYTRDYLTAFFAHPATVGFMKWGFWENAHWLPSGAMYRSDWTLKPNGQVWKDLTQKEWWTDVAGTTDANGAFRTRGFLGEYDVEVTTGGTTRTLPLTAIAGAPNYVRQGAAQAKGNIATVVNGASWQSGPVAPGEIITIYGAGLGANGGVQGFGDFEGRLSKWAGDTVVLVNGVPAPVVHSYPQQVSAVVPYGTAGRATIRVEYQGVMSNEIEVDVAAAVPGIFTADYSGTGQAVAENVLAAGQVRNSKDVPASAGQFMTIYITGEGPTTPAGVDGVAPVYPNNPRPVAPVTVHVGGVDVQPDWVGVIYAGVTQINFRLPQTVATGDAVPLAVSVGAARSRDGITVAIR